MFGMYRRDEKHQLGDIIVKTGSRIVDVLTDYASCRKHSIPLRRKKIAAHEFDTSRDLMSRTTTSECKSYHYCTILWENRSPTFPYCSLITIESSEEAQGVRFGRLSEEQLINMIILQHGFNLPSIRTSKNHRKIKFLIIILELWKSAPKYWKNKNMNRICWSESRLNLSPMPRNLIC